MIRVIETKNWKTTSTFRKFIFPDVELLSLLTVEVLPDNEKNGWIQSGYHSNRNGQQDESNNKIEVIRYGK